MQIRTTSDFENSIGFEMTTIGKIIVVLLVAAVAIYFLQKIVKKQRLKKNS